MESKSVFGITNNLRNKNLQIYMQKLLLKAIQNVLYTHMPDPFLLVLE